MSQMHLEIRDLHRLMSTGLASLQDRDLTTLTMDGNNVFHKAAAAGNVDAITQLLSYVSTTGLHWPMNPL